VTKNLELKNTLYLMSYLNQWSVFCHTLSLIFWELLEKKGGKKCFSSENFPHLWKQKNWKKKTDPNHQQLINRKNKNKNQIWEWEFRRDGSQKVANNLAIEWFFLGQILHSCEFKKWVDILGYLTFIFPDFEI
jgi:hypothetical protein